MSMTYTDTDLLEQLRDSMLQILSRLEESAGTLRQMHSQMLAEDLALSFYPQWEQAVEGCGSAKQKTERLCETVNRFLTVLEAASQEYAQMEQQHVQSIERLSVRMSALGGGLAGVMSPEYPVGLEEGTGSSQAERLTEQVAGSAAAMETASLLAVTQVLTKKYAYDEVMPGIPAAVVSPQEDGEKKEKKKKKKDAEGGGRS